jgi:hypothetical protein
VVNVQRLKLLPCHRHPDWYVRAKVPFAFAQSPQDPAVMPATIRDTANGVRVLWAHPGVRSLRLTAAARERLVPPADCLRDTARVTAPGPTPVPDTPRALAGRDAAEP